MSRSTRLTIIAVALLLAAGLLFWAQRPQAPPGPAPGEASAAPEPGQALTPHPPGHAPRVGEPGQAQRTGEPGHGSEVAAAAVLPGPVGPQDAPVQLVAIVTKGTCQAPRTLDLVSEAARKFAGKVRGRFLDADTAEACKIAQAAGITFQNGIALNGKCSFTIAGAEGPRTLALQGPVLDNGHGSGGMSGYSREDLYACIEAELAAKGR